MRFFIWNLLSKDFYKKFIFLIQALFLWKKIFDFVHYFFTFCPQIADKIIA